MLCETVDYGRKIVQQTNNIRKIIPKHPLSLISGSNILLVNILKTPTLYEPLAAPKGFFSSTPSEYKIKPYELGLSRK